MLGRGQIFIFEARNDMRIRVCFYIWSFHYVTLFIWFARLRWRRDTVSVYCWCTQLNKAWLWACAIIFRDSQLFWLSLSCVSCHNWTRGVTNCVKYSVDIVVNIYQLDPLKFHSLCIYRNWGSRYHILYLSSLIIGLKLNSYLSSGSGRCDQTPDFHPVLRTPSLIRLCRCCENVIH